MLKAETGLQENALEPGYRKKNYRHGWKACDRLKKLYVRNPKSHLSAWKACDRRKKPTKESHANIIGESYSGTGEERFVCRKKIKQ